MTRGQRGEIIVDFRRKDVADTVRPSSFNLLNRVPRSPLTF